VADLPAILGDRGFRWVQGVKTPSYGVRGGKVVKTGWRGWVTRKRILLGRVRNWIEARSYWGLVARVNLIRNLPTSCLRSRFWGRGWAMKALKVAESRLHEFTARFADLFPR
jgi:hypothetical protein